MENGTRLLRVRYPDNRPQIGEHQRRRDERAEGVNRLPAVVLSKSSKA